MRHMTHEQIGMLLIFYYRGEFIDCAEPVFYDDSKKTLAGWRYKEGLFKFDDPQPLTRAVFNDCVVGHRK